MIPATPITSSNINNLRQCGEFLLAGAAPKLPEGISELYDLNVRHVINLWNNDDHSEKEAIVVNGMGTGDMSYSYRPLPGLVIFGTEPKQRVVDTVREVLEFIKEEIVTFVACEFGRDRTPMITGCYHIIHDGWTVDEATDEMFRFGDSILQFGMRETVEWFAEQAAAGTFPDLQALV